MSSTITALTSGGGLAMAGDTSGQLELKTNNGTIAVTIDTSQNVGIAGTNSGYKLYVNGSVGTTSNISIEDSDNTRGYTVGRGKIISNGAGGFGGLSFQTYNGGFNTAATIDGNGNVMLGTTSTSVTSTLQVKRSGGTPVAIHNSGGTSGFFNEILFLNNAGTADIGYISRVNDSSVAYNTSSDYRLKEDIAPMTGALAKVTALKPVTYKWKADGSNGQGFIAHELQAIVPDCVTGEKDAVDEEGNPKYQGVDTSFLVATLTAAIQELNAKVTALEEQVINLGVK
jgi:hypothetical protein